MLAIVRNPHQQLMSKLANISLIICLFLWAIGGAQGGVSVTPGESSKLASDDQEGQIATIKSLTRGAMKEYNLKALIVQVTEEGRNLYTEAFGESVGYLPSKKLTVAVAVTYGPKAFDDQGNYKKVSDKIFSSLGNALAPDTLSEPGP